jgi:hypothetical protein
MFESISNLFAAGGPMATGTAYTPDNQTKMGGIWDQYNTGKIDADTASRDTSLVEKGSILGMTPSTFASVAGQMGAAISPKGSWQQQLGSAAAQMGSQKIGQLLQAEKEKRTTDLLKQILGQAKTSDLSKALSVGDMPALKGSGLSLMPSEGLKINDQFKG